MSLQLNNQALIALKAVFKKVQTADNKGVNNEAEPFIDAIDSDNIFLDKSTDPAIAVSEGFAIQVTANLVEDITSNGQAYFAVWPNPLPAGAPVGVAPGDRVINAISPAIAISYEAKPFDTFGNAISPGDPRNWLYFYGSGVFYQEQTTGNAPTTIDLYAYIGRTLTDVIASPGNNTPQIRQVLPVDTVGQTEFTIPEFQEFLDFRIDGRPLVPNVDFSINESTNTLTYLEPVSLDSNDLLEFIYK